VNDGVLGGGGGGGAVVLFETFCVCCPPVQPAIISETSINPKTSILMGLDSPLTNYKRCFWF
jgi:hypothetical protein